MSFADVEKWLREQGISNYTISEDLYVSVDDARDQIERQLTAKKDKGDTMFRRGARSIKKMMKGLSSRNPFTSKY